MLLIKVILLSLVLALVKSLKAVDLLKNLSTPNLNLVNTFKSQTNCLFESMMNPMLKIVLDLNDKVDDNVNKILSRRYIVKFQTYDDGTFTTKGSQAYNDFVNQFFKHYEYRLKYFSKLVLKIQIIQVL